MDVTDKEKRVFHEHFKAMNTRFDAVIYGVGSIQANDFFFELKTEVFRIENILNRFDEQSITGIINANAFRTEVEVETEYLEILADCKRFAEITHGAFDISLSPIIKIWNEALIHGEKPTALAIEEIKAQLGMDKIELTSSGTVRLLTPVVQLDFGGYGKGYTMERIKNLANRYEIKNGFFSFGDSSIMALGHHPYGDCWKVGIKDYFSAQNLIVCNLKDSALSVSGNSPENLIDKAQVYGNIIIPSSGNLVQGYITSIVKSQSSIYAEVFSTSLLTCMEDNNEKLCNNSILEAYLIGYAKNNIAEVSKII